MPKPPPRVTLRNQPRQARSRATVDAILQAATYILRRRGYEPLTTNAIAARAGVNIASLYQYFPNKQAILGALIRRHVTAARANLAAALDVAPDVAPATPRASIRAMIEVTCAAHAVEPELHEIFTTWGARLGLPELHSEIDGALADAGRRWARAMQGKLPDPELALWIARTAIHAVVHQAFVERKAVATSPLLVDELVRLIAPFLEPPARRSISPRSPRRRRTATPS